MRKTLHQTLVWLMLVSMLFTFLPVSALADSSAATDAPGTEQSAPSAESPQNENDPDPAESEEPAGAGETEPAEGGETSGTETGKNGLGSILSDIFSGGEPTVASVEPDEEYYRTYIFLADGKEVARQIVKNGETLLRPATPTVDGYRFSGWTDAGGSAFTAFGTVTGITATEEVKVYASLVKLYYIYFLDAQGKAVEVTKSGISGETISFADVSIPVESDQKVVGWTYNGTAYTEYTLEDEDVTMTPTVAEGFWITYDSNGGSYVEPDFYVAGSVPTAPTAPTRPGYTFAGWYSGDKAADFSSITESTTLTAKWTAAKTTYTVIYWAENADDDDYSYVKVEQGTGTTGTTTNVSAGTYQSGFEAKDVEQQTIQGDGSTIVNVYFDRIEYTIRFYTRGSSGTEYTDLAITAKYGAYIGDKWPTYNGSSSWYTTSSGSTAQVNLQIMPLNGAKFYGPQTGRGTSTAYYYVEVLPGESSETTYDGMSCKLHHKDTTPGSSYTVTVEDQYPIDGFTYAGGTRTGSSYSNAKFYYSRNSYSISYISGGQTAATVSYKYQADISAASSQAAPSSAPAGKEGYIFVGWYLDEAGTKAYDSTGKTMPSNNITLYAKWAAPTYDVTITYVDATGSVTDKQVVAYGETVVLPDYTAPDGYAFLGWVKADGTPFNPATKVYQSYTLRAKIASTVFYTVTYDANGGANAPTDTNTYAEGASAIVAEGSGMTAKDGCVFLGWASSADADAVEYYPGSAVAIGKENVTLYAVWAEKEDTLTLTYKANGGVGEDTTVSGLLNNSRVTLAGAIFTRPGYTLTGWARGAGATKAEFNIGGTARVDYLGENVLYAVWTANSNTAYKVEFYYDGVLTDTAERTGTTDTEVSVTEKDKTPSSDRYVFDESAENILSGTVAGEGTLVLKVYFKRNIVSYTVHHYLSGTEVPVADDDTGTMAVGETLTAGASSALYAEYAAASVSSYSPAQTREIAVSGNVITVYYTVPLTLTAGTAGKTYDGTALTDGTFTAEGLVNGDTADKITLSMTGESTITNVGEQVNKINTSSVKYNGTKLPSYYVVSYVDGKLTVKAVSGTVTVTITEKSGTAEYDGKSHSITGYASMTSDNALYSVKSVEETATDAWTATGTDAGTYAVGIEAEDFRNTDPNFADVEFVIVDGALEITPYSKTVTVTVTENSGTAEYDGTEHSVSGYKSMTANSTLYDVAAVKATETEAWTARGTNAGTYELGIEAKDFANTDPNFADVQFVIKDGTLEITKYSKTVTVTVTENSGTAEYDGAEHTVSGYKSIESDSALYDVTTAVKETATDAWTAKGTDVGSYPVGIKAADFENIDPNFASVKFVIADGALDITAATGKVIVTITENSGSAEYDGEAHTVSGYASIVSSDPLYDVSTSVKETKTGAWTVTGTNAGTYELGIQASDFKNTNANFSDVEFVIVDGSLSISQKSVTITAGSDKREYDGTPLTSSAYTSTDLAATDHFDSVTLTGSITAVGKTANTASDAVIKNKGGHDVTANYAITYVPGELEITQNTKAVSVTANSNSWMYDGTGHSDGGYTVTYDGKDYTAAAGESVTLPTGDKVTAVITSSVKNVEDTKTGNNTLTVTVENADQYKTVTTTPGTLTVTERHVTLTSADDTKVYDRTPLTNDTVTVSEDGFAEGEDPILTVTGSQTLVGESENTFGYELAAGSLASNYVITTVFGTLKVTGDKIVPAKTTPDVQSDYQLGDKIPFTISVENVSTEAATDITVTDASAVITAGTGYTVSDDGHTAVIASVASGATVAVSAEHTVTSDDILAGTVGNTATVSWGDTTKTVSADSHDINAPIVSLELVKTSDTNGEKLKLDDVVSYTVSVTNTGNIPYEVSLTDALTGVKVSGRELAVGETYTDTFGTHTVTEEDIQNGSVTNTVVAVVAPVSYKAYEDGQTVTKKTEKLTEEASVTDQTVGTDKDLTIVKQSTDSSKRYALGETITYTIAVTNTGNQTLNNIVLTDTIAAAQITAGSGYTASGNTAAIASLKPGASVTVNAQYTVTSDDIKAGKVVNSVTAVTDDEPVSKHITPATDSTAALNTALSVTKKSDKTGEVKLGETITYTITVKNEGNVPYTNVQVVDALTGLDEVIEVLAVGETKIFTTTYTVKSDDVLAGKIVNAVTAKGDSIPDPDDPSTPKTPEGTDEITDETADVDVTLTVTKVSDKTADVALGETVTYTITVKNDGNVPYYNVKVSDPLTGLSDSIDELKVGETKTFTTSYTAKSSDILAGEIVNTVTAKADAVADPKAPAAPKTPEGSAEVTDETADVNAALTVTKTSDKTENVKLGEVITYTVTVKNDGNVPYYNVKVSDPLTDAEWNIDSLAVGETKTFTTAYTVKSDDILKGSIVNSVTAKGDDIVDPKDPDTPKTPEGEGETENETDDVNAKLTVTKTSDKTENVKLGETVTYTITVKNDGNVPYYNVKVSDPLTDAEWNIEELAVGETKTFTTAYTVKSDDILKGSIVNAVTAKGDDIVDPKNPDTPKTPAGEDQTENETDDVNAKLTVTKTSDKTENVQLDEVITYTITVKNDGNVPYYNVKVSDPLTEAEWNIDELKVGETKEFTTSYTVKSDDILKGSIVNAVTAKGDDITDPKHPTTPKTPEGEDEVTDKTDDVNAGLKVTKKSDKTAAVKLGETITYTITVTNDGNVPYYNVKVSDPLTGLSESIATLAVGETQTFTTTYTATSKDILAGEIVNTVTAKADKVNGKEPTGSATVTDETADVDATLTVTKTSDKTGAVKLGETITYTVTVKNDGNVPYYNVKVSDPLTGANWSIGELKVGETKSFTTTHTVTSDDILAGKIVNTVTAKGDDIVDPKDPDTPKTPEGEGETENRTDEVRADLTMEKTVVQPKEYYKLGETVTYSIKVTNTGNVPCTDVAVTDALTGLDEVIPTLAVGETKTFTTTYTVQESDLGSGDYGTITNAAAVEGKTPDPTDPDVEKPADPTDTDSVDVKTSIRIVITANDNTVAYDGQAHGENGYVVTGLKDGHDLTVTVAGSQVKAAVYEDELVPKNAKITEDGTDVTRHYEITYVPGDLTITQSAKAVTVTANSNSWVYDGKSHSDGGYTVNYDGVDYTAEAGKSVTLPTGDKVTAKITASVKYVEDTQDGNNPIVSLTVENADQYMTIESVAGTLAVTPVTDTVTVTVTENSGTAEYDGEEHSVSGYKSMTASDALYDVKANVAETGTAAWTAAGTNVGTYDLGIEPGDFRNTNENFANVEFVIVDGALEITPYAKTVTVTVTGTSDSAAYDGEEHSVSGLTSVVSDNALYDVTASVKQTETDGWTAKGTLVGKYPQTIEASDFENTDPNFAEVKFVIENGTLEITPSTRKVVVTVTENSDTVVYDGSAHTVKGYASMFANSPLYDVKTSVAETETAAWTAVGTNVGEYEVGIELGDFKNTNPNFSDVEFVVVDGSLVITKAPIKEYVTLTPNDAEKVYDGKVLKAQSATAVDKNGGALTVEYSTDGENWTEDPGTITATEVADSTTVQIRVSGSNYEGYVTGEQALTVTPRPTTVTADDVTVTFDGKQHGLAGYSADNLVSGQKAASVQSDFTAKDAGTYTDEIDVHDVVIEDASGRDVTANYSVTYEPGTLVIDPYTGKITVTITGATGVFHYDGMNHTVSGYDIDATVPFYTEDEIVFTGNAEITEARPGDYDMGLKLEDFSDRGVNFTNVTFIVTDGSMRIFTNRYYIAWMFDTDQLINDEEPDTLFSAMTGYIRNQDISLVLHTGDVVADAESEGQWNVFNDAMQGVRESEDKTVLMIAGEKETNSSLFQEQTDWSSFADEDLYEGGKGYAYRFNIGERSMILVGLSADAMTGEAFEWAKGRFDSAPEASGILMVPEYLLEDMKAEQKIAESAAKLEEIVVKECENVRLVLSSSGGYESHHEFMYGERKVIAINSDYEAAAKAGYFTLLTYNEDLNILSVSNLCPYTYDFVYNERKAENECFVFTHVF